MEMKDVATMIGVVIGNMIGMAGVAKYITDSVVKHNETLPLIAESVKTMTESIKELRDTTTDHESRITRVELVHELNGCDKPGGKQ